MNDLIQAGIAFVVIAVVLVIGSGIVVMTNTQVQAVAGNGTLLQSVVTSAGTALTTFTSMLPILALAIVGGLALAYVLGFFRAKG